MAQTERSAIYGYYREKDTPPYLVGFSGFIDHDPRTRKVEGTFNDSWGISQIDGIYIPGERLEFEKNYVMFHDSSGHGSRQNEDVFYRYEFNNGVYVGTYLKEDFDKGLTYTFEGQTQAWVHQLPTALNTRDFDYEPLHRQTRSKLIIPAGYPQY